MKLEEQRAAQERQQNANEHELFGTGESGLSDNEDHEGGPDKDDEGDDKIEESESDRIWDEYIDGDFDQKAAVLEKTIDDPNLLEKFDCFELFHELHESCRHFNDRQVFKKLTQRLKQEYPDRYKKVQGYLIQSLIQDALIEQNKTEAGKMFLEFADDADKDIDSFNRTLEQIAFDVDLDLLLSAMRRGWEKVKDSPEIVPWGIDEYANLAAEYAILKHVSEVPNPDATDSDLLKELEQFIDPDVEKLKTYLAHITGTSGKVWKSDDFNFQIKRRKEKKAKRRPKDPGEKRLSIETFSMNVHHFTSEFLGYYVRKEGVSFPKAETARSELRRYLIDRAQGELEAEPSMFEKIMQPELKNKKKQPPSFDHILCPDKKTLDVFIGKMLNFFSFKLFRAVIFFASIPAWLQFLEIKGLIEQEMRRNTMSSVFELFADIRNVIESESKDKDRLITYIEKAYSRR
ncbi:MAG: hypothetical protein JRK26_10270 [Deltaproteobacteria bacterium]|nr:hypothetical protein [Deltaproteobacteria bacterium]